MPRVPPVTTAPLLMFPSLIFSGGLWDLPFDSTASALDRQRYSHAAADAERRQALLGVAPPHFVQQRHQHAGARGADGMADRDRPAIDVYDRGIPAHVLVDCQSLRRKSLVG